ncbi:MAG TPA: PqqD family protein [Gemmatimonadales bacterium]|nr:PqqD family protein [Gemmatimonadales bacterium]
MIPMTDRARFAAKPGVIATDLEQEMVLLDPETQEMFRLNRTGRDVWLHLSLADVAGLAGGLTQRFSVGREQAHQDVRVLLGELLEAGLILPVAERG